MTCGKCEWFEKGGVKESCMKPGPTIYGHTEADIHPRWCPGFKAGTDSVKKTLRPGGPIPYDPKGSLEKNRANLEASLETTPLKRLVKRKRKAISIVANDGFGLVALCDDGTMWVAHTGGWRMLADIPPRIEGEELKDG